MFARVKAQTNVGMRIGLSTCLGWSSSSTCRQGCYQQVMTDRRSPSWQVGNNDEYYKLLRRQLLSPAAERAAAHEFPTARIEQVRFRHEWGSGRWLTVGPCGRGPVGCRCCRCSASWLQRRYHERGHGHDRWEGQGRGSGRCRCLTIALRL
ncbi:hypothetical protein GGR57DRAFT_118896 [Xylariaceae sp. FL1272]|nr:hypothetical protein GGR57DRAFT_118896 [Xylariaceae sp. FL1272]